MFVVVEREVKKSTKFFVLKKTQNGRNNMRFHKIGSMHIIHLFKYSVIILMPSQEKKLTSWVSKNVRKKVYRSRLISISINNIAFHSQDSNQYHDIE